MKKLILLGVLCFIPLLTMADTLGFTIRDQWYNGGGSAVIENTKKNLSITYNQIWPLKESQIPYLSDYYAGNKAIIHLYCRVGTERTGPITITYIMGQGISSVEGQCSYSSVSMTYDGIPHGLISFCQMGGVKPIC